MNIFLLLVGLVLILAGANFLTDGAAALAQRFRVPEFIVGLTVVAIGTSMPELVVSVLSAAAHNSDVAVGNIVGSNLFNVFVILGICALIRPLALSESNIAATSPWDSALRCSFSSLRRTSCCTSAPSTGSAGPRESSCCCST